MKLIIVPLSILVLSACGSTQIEPDNSSSRADGLKKLKLDFEEIMEFEQGKSSEYPITTSVASPGSAILSGEGLPDGAEIQGNVLTYLPPCSLSLAEGKFYRGYISFRIRIALKSDKDPESSIQKAGLMIVYRYNDPDHLCGE